MTADTLTQFTGLGLALGIGFLVGLEREWAENKLVGLRSFALLGLTGGLAGLLAADWGAWIVASGLIAVVAVILFHALRHERRDDDPEGRGSTTLMATLAVYLAGAACATGHHAIGVVTGGVITLLLHWKRPLHAQVRRIGEAEFNAVIRLVLITLVVLPILPNRTFGPYDVFNPFQAWLLVVLIVGLNVVGYVALRLMRADSGALLGGVLGGLISSTATTVSFAGISRTQRDLSACAALVILIASTVVYGRVGVELLLVSPDLLRHAAAPMAAFAAVMLVASAVVFPRVHRQRVTLPEQDNPARLQMALSFALLYVVIVFAVAAAKTHLGEDAIYAVALISGLTDVDAMTLSVAQLHDRGTLSSDVAWRSIFLATLSNLMFKVGAASVLGSPALRAWMLPLGGGALASGVAMLLLWP